MYKHFKSVSLMMLLMSLPMGAAYAAQTPNAVQSAQQNNVVKGVIKDAEGAPLIGASVQVKGTTNSVIVVDDNGSFTLRGVRQGSTIRISYIGYVTQELVWNGQDLEVVLKEMDNALGEAVVIGYGVARKSDLTGSVTAIKPDEKNKGLVVNAQDMIQGKIAGVNVTTNSGTPGSGATIRIRGGSSLNASNDPLIVIDGLAMDNSGVKGLSNPLSMVNPADIESFTVLKDASATAIYGSRGSNGVIIITTKKGRTGMPTKVSYNGNVSINQKRKTIDVMDGDAFRAYIKNTYGEDSDAFRALGTANTDWQEAIYRTAISQDHSVTISGGVGNMPFRVGLGYTDQQGVLKTSDFERYTASLNLNPTFFQEHLKVNFSAKYMHANTRYANAGAVNAAVVMDPTQPIKSTDAKFNSFKGYYQWTQDGTVLNDPTWGAFTTNGQATRNPLSMLDLKDDHARSQSVVSNLELDYKIHGFEDLRLHMNVGGDYSTGKQNTVTDPASPESIYYGWKGWEKIDKYNLSFNAYAQYMKDFNEANHFDIMAGYEWQHFHRQGKSSGSGWYPMTNLLTPGAQNNPSKGDWKTENFLVSFFGRANYSLLDRYLLTATFRYDGSSRFQDKWALFPSFAFGWKVNNEAFLCGLVERLEGTLGLRSNGSARRYW